MALSNDYYSVCRMKELIMLKDTIADDSFPIVYKIRTIFILTLGEY